MNTSVFFPLALTVLFWLLIVSTSVRMAAQREWFFSCSLSASIALGVWIISFSWLLSGTVESLTNLTVILSSQVQGGEFYWKMAQYTSLHLLTVLATTVGVAFISQYLTRLLVGGTWQSWLQSKPSAALFISIALMLGQSLLLKECLPPVFHGILPVQAMPFIR